ncbi:hypothetical protein FHX42_000797 [Saccharopolyspora lacisalsi]|uniref:Uncharacterized protein n=1 Tax=Halosaccharopolyspora lacisalsi TaxID=1000566 RepID=A0A839DXJ9_9PSEU|nr:hypothetical protein [Halosaccharopolyspora lacisalsi]
MKQGLVSIGGCDTVVGREFVEFFVRTTFSWECGGAKVDRGLGKPR